MSRLKHSVQTNRQIFNCAYAIRTSCYAMSNRIFPLLFTTLTGIKSSISLLVIINRHIRNRIICQLVVIANQVIRIHYLISGKSNIGQRDCLSSIIIALIRKLACIGFLTGTLIESFPIPIVSVLMDFNGTMRIFINCDRIYLSGGIFSTIFRCGGGQGEQAEGHDGA